MEFLKKFNRGYLENNLNDDHLKTIKIIIGALNAGLFIFFVIALSFYFNGSDASTGNAIDENSVNIYLLILLVLTIISNITSRIIPDKMIATENEQIAYAIAKSENDLKTLIELFQTHYILRFAILESISLFGLVVFFLFN